MFYYITLHCFKTPGLGFEGPDLGLGLGLGLEGPGLGLGLGLAELGLVVCGLVNITDMH